MVPVNRHSAGRFRRFTLTTRNLGPGRRLITNRGRFAQPATQRKGAQLPRQRCGCGECRACKVWAWKQAKKVTGHPARSPHAQQWFDHEHVRRVWNGEATTRKSTLVERQYLANLVGPDIAPKALGRLLGMEPAAAMGVAQDVWSGRVAVPRRDWAGKPVIRTLTQ